MGDIVFLLDRLDRQIFVADEANSAVEKALAFEACSLLIDQLDFKLGGMAVQLREKSADLRLAITAMVGGAVTAGGGHSQHFGWALASLQSIRIYVLRNFSV